MTVGEYMGWSEPLIGRWEASAMSANEHPVESMWGVMWGARAAPTPFEPTQVGWAYACFLIDAYSGAHRLEHAQGVSPRRPRDGRWLSGCRAD
jgi:hypothetical protein